MMSPATESTTSLRSSSWPVVGWLTCRICPQRMEQVRREVCSWAWWSGERRRHPRCINKEVILFGLTDFLRIGRTGRDVDVDVLATELVIDWRLAHRVTL